MSIERVFVAGAGLMGHGIAQVHAAVGKEVTLYEPDMARAEAGIARIAGNLERAVAKGKLAADAREEVLARLTGTDDLSQAGDADLVVEAVFEDADVKARLWADLDAVAPADCIFASNTSSISIDTLCEAVSPERRPRFVGMHFFSPVPVMPLVELIRGAATDDATEAAIRGLAGDLGKQVIVSADRPGFIVNRILMPFLGEAMRALEEGVGTAEDIDAGARVGLNHPMGPLELADFIGLDVCLGIMRVLDDGIGGPQFAPPQGARAPRRGRPPRARRRAAGSTPTRGSRPVRSDQARVGVAGRRCRVRAMERAAGPNGAVYIVSAARTPIGKFGGALAAVPAVELGAVAIRAAVERAGLALDAPFDEVLMGQVLQGGAGQAPARQALLRAGLSTSTPATTINRVCGSGLKAIMLAAAGIRAGDGDLYVAGGMESMNLAPYLLRKARFGYRLGAGSLDDSAVADGLWCAVDDCHMGTHAERVAIKAVCVTRGPGPVRAREPPAGRRGPGRGTLRCRDGTRDGPGRQGSRDRGDAGREPAARLDRGGARPSRTRVRPARG